jgi:putative oxidoreductase
MKLSRLFQPPPLSSRTSAGLLVLRLVAGWAFILHGYGKITNPFGWMGPDAGVPGVFQALAAISEFGGGIAWMLGLLTPLFSFGLLCTMAVATHMHAVVLGDPFVKSGPGPGELMLTARKTTPETIYVAGAPGTFSPKMKRSAENRPGPARRNSTATQK